MDDTQIQRVRAISLEAVLERFGAERDPKDPKHNWRIADSRITVTGERFYDHNRATGGGGSIDLYAHLQGIDARNMSAQQFKDAVRSLSGDGRLFEKAAALAAAPKTLNASEPRLPVRDDSKLNLVRRYLTDTRSIPGTLVDEQIAKGRVFADQHANAVFRLRDENHQDIGYELRGTSGKPFHGAAGRKGVFVVGEASSRSAAFVESAIEALSYRALKGQGIAISTTGNAADLPEAVGRKLLERGFELITAFNADREGDRMSARLSERLGIALRRDRPIESLGKDWNEQLRSLRGRTDPANGIAVER